MKKILLTGIICLCLVYSYTFAQKVDSVRNVELEEVEISAFRTKTGIKNLPYKVEVLRKNEISQHSAESVSDILKKASNIDIVEYTGIKSSIGLRGFAPTAHGVTYTKIFIDGIPTGTENISSLGLCNIEQAEIIKGPFSSFYGSGAMGGIINLATPKSKETISGKVGATLGSFQTYSFFANVGGKITDKLNFDFYGKIYRRDKDYKTGSNSLLSLDDTAKYTIMDRSYGKTYEHTKFNRNNVGLRLGVDLNKFISINLYQDLFISKGIQTHGTLWGIYGDVEKDIQRWSQRLELDVNAGIHNIKASGYFNNENEQYYNILTEPKYISDKANTKTYGLIIQDALTFGNHQVIFGLNNNTVSHVAKRWNGETSRVRPYTPDYSNSSTGLFTQANFNFLKSMLNISVGGRYDFIKFELYETELMPSTGAAEKYNVFNPNAAIQFQPIKGLKIHTSTGTAFTAPNAFQVAGIHETFMVYRGNPDLKPEKSFSYDFGLTYDNKKYGVFADVTYFDNKLTDMIVEDYSDPVEVSFLNADKARMKGIEVSLTYDFGAFSEYKYSLKVYTNFTKSLKSEVTTTDFLGNEVKEDMKYVKDLNMSFGVAFRHNNGLAARINGRYMGTRIEDNWFKAFDMNTFESIPCTDTDGTDLRPEMLNTDIIKHPAFLVFDVYLAYTLLKKFRFSIKLDNLLDENYYEKDTYNMPGRTITGGFTFLF